MFPDLPEGNLDAYRQALVQNQHLADLALVILSASLITQKYLCLIGLELPQIR